MRRSDLALACGLFFLSGMPALVYQVVWQRVLSLHFGVDVYSTAITVAVFMLGLGLGSLAGGRLADRVRRPGLLYAAAEALTGLYGLTSLVLMGIVGERFAGAGLVLLVPLEGALLLPPTLLMGATLPLMARAVIGEEAVLGRQVALLYGVNTGGAALGALLAAWLLVGLLGFDGTVLAAAGLNLALALGVALLFGRPGAPVARQEPAAAPAGSAAAVPPWPLVWALAALSGLVALGFQLAAYRLLTILLKGSAYTFGTLLFVFLTGIALGSLLWRRALDPVASLRRFALSQTVIALWLLFLALFLVHGAGLPGLRHLLAASFFITYRPEPALLEGVVDLVTLYSALDILFWPALFLAVPTLAMGVGFPALIRAGSASLARLGRSLGGLYLANILGSGAGSLLVGFWLLDRFGSERALQAVTALAAVTALLALAGARGRPVTRPAGLAVAVLAASLLVFPAPGSLLRTVHLAGFEGVGFAFAETRTGVVALRRQERVVAFPEEEKLLHETRLYVGGAQHGRLDAPPLALREGAARLDEEWALAAHPQPRRVLLIGLGDAEMAELVLARPEVAGLTVVELDAGLRRLLGGTERGRRVFADPRLRYVVDDGRRWLLANPDERFDFVFMFPVPAGHAYYTNLYSREFLDLVRARLAPGGMLALRTSDSYASARTLALAFPAVLRLGSDFYLASTAPIGWRVASLPGPASSLLGRIEADRERILEATEGVPQNRDLQPNSEYFLTYPWRAVLAVNRGQAARAALDYRFEEPPPAGRLLR